MLNIRFLWKQKLSRTLIGDYELGSKQQDKLIKKKTSPSAFHFPFAFQSKKLR